MRYVSITFTYFFGGPYHGRHCTTASAAADYRHACYGNFVRALCTEPAGSIDPWHFIGITADGIGDYPSESGIVAGFIGSEKSRPPGCYDVLRACVF